MVPTTMAATRQYREAPPPRPRKFSRGSSPITMPTQSGGPVAVAYAAGQIAALRVRQMFACGISNFEMNFEDCQYGTLVYRVTKQRVHVYLLRHGEELVK